MNLGAMIEFGAATQTEPPPIVSVGISVKELRR